MPSKYPAPADSAIEEVMSGLVSTGVQVTRAHANDPEKDATGIIAEFVNDDDELAVVAFADHDVVNFVGGAINEIGEDALAEASGNATVLEQGVEGFRSVAGALPSCFKTDFTPGIRLREVKTLPTDLGEDSTELWRKPAGRRAFRVTVADSGAGMLIVYLS